MARSVLCGIVFTAIIILSQPASAHTHEPVWMQENNLEHGLHIAVHHPRVIRQHGPIDLKVIVRNVASDSDIVVERIQYDSPSFPVSKRRQMQRTLPSRKQAYIQYKASLEDLHQLAHLLGNDAVQKLAAQNQSLLADLNEAALSDTISIPATAIPAISGESFRMTIDITVREDSRSQVFRRVIDIPIQQALPEGSEKPASHWIIDVPHQARKDSDAAAPALRSAHSPWFAGDQHLHTTYSLDALALEGTTENVTDYAAAAELIGLDWIIITDHSNVHATWEGTEYYTEAQFNEGTAQAAAWTASNPLLALYGEEMGAGDYGLFSLPSHYLAYPFSVDSTGYLPNPSSGLLFGLANCESEQTIIDRINNAGGFGFIAHPFDSGTLAFVEWNFNNGATGWSGLEIWSDTNGQIKSIDTQAFNKWHDLLNEIAAPQQGSLSNRPGFPNAFPTGLGNSDAHVPGLIGATFTYAWMEDNTRPQVTEALMRGRCVASNGPLVFGQLNGAQTGEVAFLLDGDNSLDITLNTTPEFGPVGDYTITVYVNGAVFTTIAPTGDTGYSALYTLQGLNLSSPDKFVTIRADSADDTRHAIANPIWLQFTTAGDANADGVLDLQDFPIFSDCLTGPNIPALPECDIMDFDRDQDVDLDDFGNFQQDLVFP